MEANLHQNRCGEENNAEYLDKKLSLGARFQRPGVCAGSAAAAASSGPTPGTGPNRPSSATFPRWMAQVWGPEYVFVVQSATGACSRWISGWIFEYDAGSSSNATTATDGAGSG